MSAEIRDLDVVALLEDLPAKHFHTAAPLLLRRGQMGAVVMGYDGSAFEVEFVDPKGQTYAMLPVSASKLMVLHDTAAV